MERTPLTVPDDLVDNAEPDRAVGNGDPKEALSEEKGKSWLAAFPCIICLTAVVVTLVGLWAYFAARREPLKTKDLVTSGSLEAASREKRPPGVNRVSECLMPMSFLDDLPCKRFYPGSDGLDVFAKLGDHMLPMFDIDAELTARGLGSNNRTCAVVSSSGRIAEHDLGSEIDRHDVVIRFNHAETRGFETHSGGKTTIRMINSELLKMRMDAGLPVAPELSPAPNTTVAWTAPLVVIRDFNDDRNLDHWLVHDWNHFRIAQNYVKWRRSQPGIPSYLLNGAFHRYAWNFMDSAREEVDGPKAHDYHNSTTSTGMEGVLLALQLCEQVDVYEIAASDKITYKPYYWVKDRDKPDFYCPHNCMVERPWLISHSSATSAELKEHGKVTLDRRELFANMPWLKYEAYAPDCP